MDSPAAITGPINLGNPVEFTMLELAKLILEETGSSSPLIRQPLPQDDPKQRHAGYQPRKRALRLGARSAASRGT